MSDHAMAPARSAGLTVDPAALILPSDYFSRQATRIPDRVALIWLHHTWTYRDLDGASDRMAGLLRGHGLQPGERVVYIGKNNDLFFIFIAGALRAGLVAVPVNWRNTAPETGYILEDCGARLILTDREFYPMVEAANTTRQRVILIDEEGAAGLRASIDAAPALPRQTLDPFQAGFQLYTSGTTGKPKGVLTTQYALGMERLSECASPGFDDWGDGEILLSPLPSFHIGGMSWVLIAFMRGQTAVLTADASPANILDLCLEHGITRTFVVPTLVRGLIEEMERRGVRASSLRGIHYGAASMSPALLERAIATLKCRFLQHYGMTEATGTITMLIPQDHDLARPHLLRSVGRPMPGYTIEIRSPDKRIMKIGEAGEIWVKGPSLFIGYWNRPEATAEVLEDGWYRSGDGGRLDEEGYLYLTDRIKDMVVTGGENVYPAEVEAVLREHPAVLDCAVFGLPHPKWGEGVTAAIELRPGHHLDAETLIAFARLSLAAYKLPRRIEFGYTLPRTAAGKIQRGAVRAYFVQKESI